MNTSPAPNTPQDGLEWLRDIRASIAERFDHDPRRYGDYLREREAALGTRIVRTQKRVVPVTEQKGPCD